MERERFPQAEPELTWNLNFQMRHPTFYYFWEFLILGKIRQPPIFRFHVSQHLVRHLLLQSTPLDAHRKMSMSHFKITPNHGTRAELCPKPFENLTFRANLWIPKISVLLIFYTITRPLLLLYNHKTPFTPIQSHGPFYSYRVKGALWL